MGERDEGIAKLSRMPSASASKSNERSSSFPILLFLESMGTAEEEEEAEGEAEGECVSCDGAPRSFGLIMAGTFPGLRRGGRGDGGVFCVNISD